MDEIIEIFSAGNLLKNLYSRILKYKLDQLRSILLKNSSLSLRFYTSSPLLLTVLIIRLLSPFKRTSYCLLLLLLHWVVSHFSLLRPKLKNPCLLFRLLILMNPPLSSWMFSSLLYFLIHCINIVKTVILCILIFV